MERVGVCGVIVVWWMSFFCFGYFDFLRKFGVGIVDFYVVM